MNENKNSIIRVVLILLAVVAVVLAAFQIIRSDGSEAKENNPQADLSGYGELTGQEDDSYDLVYDDDSTMEMDSIPNGTVASGGDVSGGDALADDAVPAE